MNIEFTLKHMKLCIIDHDLIFCNRNVKLIKYKLIDDDGYVIGYDVNDIDRNVLLTNVEMIWRWLNNDSDVTDNKRIVEFLKME